MRIFLLLLLCMASVLVKAQSEIVHLHYNLTLYGNPFGCSEAQNSTAQKDIYFKDIVEHLQPTVLCVNELGDEDQLADRILNNVLNVAGESNWMRAELTDFATNSSIINGFFYRSDQMTLVSQWYINQSVEGEWLIRPLDLYTVYLNTIPESGDTTFITFGVAHLSASDELERSAQTEALMAQIAYRGPDNYIFSGDLNVDSSFEEAFQNLLSPSDPALEFIDPVNAVGTWNNNSSHAQVHTQSTRLSDTNGGCFSGGGLDDRFDMTLVSPFVYQGSHGLIYQPESYEVVGQSGNNYNSALITNGNQAVPDNIAEALYEMSDHLPVLTRYSQTNVSGVFESSRGELYFSNPVSDQLELFGIGSERFDLEIRTTAGSLVKVIQNIGVGEVVELSSLAPGIYLLGLKSEKQTVLRKMLVIN